jgi:hypothetical protein
VNTRHNIAFSTEEKGLSSFAANTIRSGVINAMRNNHATIAKFQQALADGLNKTAPSYNDIPKFIRELYENPQKFSKSINNLSDVELHEVIIALIEEAINEFEFALEETTYAFQYRLKNALVAWSQIHDVDDLITLLEEHVNNIIPCYVTMPWLHSYLMFPPESEYWRGKILAPKYAVELMTKVLQEVIEENLSAAAINSCRPRP